MGSAIPFIIGRHVRRQVPPPPANPPVHTGVDYLGLVLAQHEEQVLGEIAFRHLPVPEPVTTASATLPETTTATPVASPETSGLADAPTTTMAMITTTAPATAAFITTELPASVPGVTEPARSVVMKAVQP